MTALTAVYMDFQDPYSWRAWKWLSWLPERAAVDIRPYSLDSETGADGGRRGPWERTRATIGLELLALGEFARDCGRQRHEAMVDAAFDAIHVRRRDLASPEEWLALGAAAGLDLAAFTADSERWRAEVGLWHREAEDELGIFAVPSLVFDENQALLVRLEGLVTDTDSARRLLDDLAGLLTGPLERG